MNKPSSTIQAAGLVGSSVSVLFLILAMYFPEVYERTSAYPGAEAAVASFITILVATIAGYLKKENVLPLVKDER